MNTAITATLILHIFGLSFLPNKVTLFSSPPKAAMFSLTHFRAKKPVLLLRYIFL